MNEQKEKKVVIKVLSDLFEDLITGQTTDQGMRITNTLFSQELRPAFSATVFAWLQNGFERNGQQATAKLMDIAKEPMDIIFDMGVCMGFSLAQKEKPFTYADEFVRRRCEHRGVDFQAVSERIGGRQE